MKITLVLIFAFFVSNNFYSQDNKIRSYYFDVVTIADTKDYSNGFMGKTIQLINQKDSTYTLFIRLNKSTKQVTLSDRKKKQTIKFDMNFEYKTVEDLNNLSNSKLYTVVKYHKNKTHKKFVEDIEYERDSVNNKTIVHLTSYKNKKRKKIINENYYFFGVNDNYDKISKRAVKNYVLEKYNLKIADNKHFEKWIHLHNGKISLEKNNIITKLIDFNFEFKIDEIYPNRISNTHLNYIKQ